MAAMRGIVHRITIVIVAAATLLLPGIAQAAGVAGACPDFSLEQPFLRWLDPLNYTPAPNGGLEAGATSWQLRGGAQVVSGNESFFVGGSEDLSSLYLPTSSSATTGTTCVELLDPVVRLFVRNQGSLLGALKVEALYKDALGIDRATKVALVVGTSSWKPTIPIPFLAHLSHPPLVTDGHVDVAFRFTPVGPGSAWRIDDVYVDPFKAR
jgi:hypothetical protein